MASPAGAGAPAAASRQSPAPFAGALHLREHRSGAVVDVVLATCDRADVVARLASRLAPAAVEVPGGCDDVFLRLDQLLETLVVAASAVP